HFRRWWRPDLEPITRLQYLDLKTYLPDDILTKVDRAAMAVGLEARPPLLDHHLIEAVFRIPAHIRFPQFQKKYLLKKAMESQLPAEIIARGKKGFSSPLMQWMAAECAWVEAFLRQPARLTHVSSLAEFGRHNWGPKCWALLVLEQWAEAQPALQ